MSAKGQPGAGIEAPLRAAWLVILAGVCASLHVAKLAPAIPALRSDLGITLVEAGFLLSTVQVAGMTLGVFMGLAADGWGLRRCMLAGLWLLSLASLAGTWVEGASPLLLLRALEGLGFMLVAMPAAPLVRLLVPPRRVSLMLGVWGAYVPTATALALLWGPLWIPAFGWHAWWWLMAGLSALMALGLQAVVPADVRRPVGEAGTRSVWTQARQGLTRLGVTLGAKGPWLVAAGFGVYSGQWLSVVGFLPSIYAQASMPAALSGVLTATVAAVNIIGNLLAGVLLHRGVAPSRVMATGYACMAVGAVLAFQSWWPADVAVRYLGVVLFSMLGGLVPGTLFSLAVRVAPQEQTISTTVGWMQQCSSVGQFLGPPLVGWVATQVGHWSYTWVVTGACALLGMGVAWALGRLRLAR